MDKIAAYLLRAGGTKVLSLELFNSGYWKRGALEVAIEGLKKMKKSISSK